MIVKPNLLANRIYKRPWATRCHRTWHMHRKTNQWMCPPQLLPSLPYDSSPDRATVLHSQAEISPHQKFTKVCLYVRTHTSKVKICAWRFFAHMPWFSSSSGAFSVGPADEKFLLVFYRLKRWFQHTVFVFAALQHRFCCCFLSTEACKLAYRTKSSSGSLGQKNMPRWKPTTTSMFRLWRLPLVQGSKTRVNFGF